MADRWMDERDRAWRRQRGYGRDDDGFRGGRYAEARSFDRGDDEEAYEGDGGYEGGRDKVFGQDQSGTSYGGETDRYAPGHMGGPSGYRSSGSERGRSGWQSPDYGGVSPAMRRGGGYGRGRFQGDDYTRSDYGRRYGFGRGERAYDEGGRYYGDDAREPVYREEWSQGRRDPGSAPRAYDAGYSETRARYHDRGYGQSGYETGGSIGYDPDPLRTASGGTGGYDYERGYGDAGRSARTRSFEDAGRGAGDFVRRAGQKVADWFSGGSEARSYDEPYRGDRRGMGPAGYKRSDDRISEDAHERLTDDSWLDASNISVSVSGGEVTLSGTVDSREAKHRAERLVDDISGVNHVQNNLRIQKAGFLKSDSTGYGDTVAEAQMSRETPIAGDGSAAKKN
jgi:hypothetical protein